MRYLKILGLTAAIGAALMGLASSASADYVSTTTGGASATPSIHLVNEGGHVTIRTPIANVSCSVTVEFTPTVHGSFRPISGPVSTISFTGCTNSWHITAVAGHLGSITFFASGSGHGGTARWHGGRVTMTRFGITCTIETSETSIGSLTGGNPGTLDIESSLPIVAGESSGLCGSGSYEWEGSLVATSALYIADS